MAASKAGERTRTFIHLGAAAFLVLALVVIASVTFLPGLSSAPGTAAATAVAPAVTAPIAAPATPAEAALGSGDGLLQLTSAGHVLGFAPDSLTIASATHMLRTGFLGANPVTPSAEAAQPGSGASTGAPSGAAASPGDVQAPPLGRVTYQGLWDGVDLVYQASAGSIAKSAYYLETGDRATSVRLSYNRPVTLDAQGALTISFDTGTMTEAAPTAWQETSEGRRSVEVSWVLLGEREAGFALSGYLPDLPVVIDPALSWNTFLGGDSYDFGFGIALDAGGNVYLSGYSYATWGSPVRLHSGGEDAFVAKLDIDGNLNWNTFLGGDSYEHGLDIALDADGNIYVTGRSGATWGSPIRPHGGDEDAFVAKLGTDGRLTWHTFLGGADRDYGRGIAVDAGGNVYVTGLSYATWGSPVRPHSAGINYDAFVAKLGTDGNLNWHTFLGGAEQDQGYGIAVDAGGNVYVSGTSNATWGSPEREYGGGGDAFVAKLTYDTTAPTVAITYSPAGPYRPGDVVLITATFSKPVADAPVPQISISGALTLAPADMTKVSDTVYTYAYTVGSGDGRARVFITGATDLIGNPVISTPTSGAYFLVDYPEPYNPGVVRYWVTVEVPEGHGSATPARQTVGHDSPATIKITPDPGYYLSGIVDNGVAQPMSSPYRVDHVTGPHHIVVTLAPYQEAPARFPDVPFSHPFYTAIEQLASRNILKGLSNGEFGPQAPLTRQQFAKMIALALGLEPGPNEICPFIDVQAGLDATDPLYPQAYVALCARLGISKGIAPVTFDPYGNLTRRHLITMVARAAGLPEPPDSYVAPLSPAQLYYQEHHANARRAAYAGLLTGIEIGPGYDFLAPATRGEAAQLLWNLYGHTHR